jgi:nitroreductase
MARGATKEQIGQLAPSVLRSLIREKVHHAIETAIELFAMKGKPASPNLGSPARDLLEEWKRRGLTEDVPDIQWAHRWLEIGRVYVETRTYRTPPHPPALAPEEVAVVERAIKDRRSIRIWKADDVPQALVDRLIEAASWAPSACNQQPVRFVTIRDRETIKMIPGDGCFEASPVIVVVALDRRSYEYLNTIPTYNPVLDAGAAIQNMLLMAYALGLGTTWGTFGDRPQNETVRRRLALPDYMEMLTYVGIGFPADYPPAPGRLPIRNLQMHERWTEQLDEV